MLNTKTIAVCSQTHTNTLCGQNVELYIYIYIYIYIERERERERERDPVRTAQ